MNGTRLGNVEDNEKRQRANHQPLSRRIPTYLMAFTLYTFAEERAAGLPFPISSTFAVCAPNHSKPSCPPPLRNQRHEMVAVVLALASVVAAQAIDRQNNMRSLAPSLIAGSVPATHIAAPGL
jgi:hypothetical protein